MKLLNSDSIKSARTLLIFALITISLVSGVHFLVRDKIEQQQKIAELSYFSEIAKEANFELSDDLLNHKQEIIINNQIITRYQVFIKQKHIADFLVASTNKGYSGKITILIAISADRKKVLGVRTLSQQETPGLGDKIDIKINPWIKSFTDKIIKKTHFAVKKDGGDFDSFTGATITPRAVTNLVGEISNAYANLPLSTK